MNIIAAILIFTVIVVIHELGHFLLAKKNGIGVPEFSVGMGPRIITFAKTAKGPVCTFFCSQKKFDSEDWQEVTKYSWKLFPIGGSCAMIGEDEDNEAENAFNNKGVWARFSVIFAGPFFNFILAFVFSVIILANNGIDTPEVTYLYDNQPAKEAGIRLGDTIRKVNGKKISIGREISTYLILHPLTGEDVEIELERNGEVQTVTLDPNYESYMFGFSYNAQSTSDTKIAEITGDSPFEKAGIKAGDRIISVNGNAVTNGEQLGKVMAQENTTGEAVTFEINRNGLEKTYVVTPEPHKTKTLGLYAESTVPAGNGLNVIKYSFIEVKYWIETTVASLGRLVTGKLSMDDVSGPVGIVDQVGSVIDEASSIGFEVMMMNILYMAVLLSANLGVMNLLPLPALDGGRLVFILIEAVRGKPVDREKEGYVHFGGFVVLMLFMVFVLYNDILKLIR
ncbi:MAG: RIP metalloprotease RseP [Lachnospiraceae bacterium]|nr:RIP metalloprotease RseP [Lachnospiraceae bacterium]